MKENEPVMLVSLINAAVLATWGVVVVVAGLSDVVAGSVTAALGAWVALAGWFIRARVTPASTA